MKKRGNLEAANGYIRSRYLPAYHAEFNKPAREDVPCRDLTVLNDILCEHHERTVGSDNCARYRRRALQIPADRHRCHYVKAKVKVLDYPGQGLAIHHGPRELTRYDARGQLLWQNIQATASCPPQVVHWILPQG